MKSQSKEVTCVQDIHIFKLGFLGFALKLNWTLKLTLY
jgi:hypothetical protein